MSGLNWFLKIDLFFECFNYIKIPLNTNERNHRVKRLRSNTLLSFIRTNTLPELPKSLRQFDLVAQLRLNRCRLKLHRSNQTD